jgi:hypothetical protein
MSPEEFMQRCVWEGGSLADGFEYGLDWKDLDSSDLKFKEMVMNAMLGYHRYQRWEKLIREEYGDFEEIVP